MKPMQVVLNVPLPMSDIFEVIERSPPEEVKGRRDMVEGEFWIFHRSCESKLILREGKGTEEIFDIF